MSTTLPHAISVEESLADARLLAVDGERPAPYRDGERPPVIELLGVTKTYTEEPPVAALRGVDLTVRRGELVAILGPSGSGKSTLLHLMGTLDLPTTGTVRITGEDVGGMSDSQLAALRSSRIGFVFQQFFLSEHATALENVADGLLYSGVDGRKRRRRAAEALTRVGLAQRMSFLPTQLSGGERQRVAIARALVGRPAILLADEPTGNLDTNSGNAIVDLLKELNADGATVVVITHDRELASHFPRQVEIRDGRIVADSAPAPSPPLQHLPLTAPAGHAGPPVRNRLRLPDLAGVASVGLRTRRLRASLSALGIAIGVAAIVAVLGLSSSSQQGLLSEIDRLGTNLLTVTNGQTIFGHTAELNTAAPGMISRIGPVQQVQFTGAVTANVYRSPLVPKFNTNDISVLASSTGLLADTGTTLAHGTFLNSSTATEPVAVLGATAAQRLGIDRVFPGERIWVGTMWFYVTGILNPSALAPELDTTILVGFPAAQTYLDFDGHPSTIYVRAATDQVAAVQSVLAATANPEAPNEVNVSQPSSALVARAAAQNAFNGLFLGLGAVALLVGAVGVANIMVISVLERRSEIGLRRSLGATKGNIRAQFLGEAILLAVFGGAAGVALGAVATTVYASTRGWSVVVPPVAWGGGMVAAIAIGAGAGLWPALRAARLSPTEALRSV